VIISEPNKIAAFRLLSLRAQLRLEARGIKSSGGAIRPRIAAEFGLKPRDSYDTYILAINKKIGELV
jgi:hypothetical protein